MRHQPSAAETAEARRRAGARLTHVVEHLGVRHEAARAVGALVADGLLPPDGGGPAGRRRVAAALLVLVHLTGQGIGDAEHLRGTLAGEVGIDPADADRLAALVQGDDHEGTGQEAELAAAYALGGRAGEAEAAAALCVLGVHALVAGEVIRDPALPHLARRHLLIEVMGEPED